VTVGSHDSPAMSSAVAELENLLQSMLALKPPGVSGSKIGGITSLCTANVQNESVLIQKIYTHFKKAPGTHKLGVLYVVDSVTRQWVEAARKSGQTPGGDAPDGTFAAGVKRVTDLLPVLMTDIINNAPQDQKDKIKKLVDIWERGATFPAPMLASFKDKMNAAQNVESNTPEGSPAPNSNPLGMPQQPPAPAAAPDTSSILKALADMAKNSNTAPAASAAPAAPANPLGAFAPAAAAADPAAQAPAMNPYGANPVANPFAGMAGMAQNPALQPPSQNGTPNPMAAANPLAGMLPQAAQPGLDPAAMAAQLQVLQMLASQGIPQDQWGTALQIFSSVGANGMAGMPGMPGMPPMPGFPQMQGQNSGAWGGRPDSQNMDDRGREYPRSPPTGYRRRSRSPGWDRRRTASPPRRRESPVYGEYHGDSPGRRGGDPRDARGRRGEYRQRSPPGARGGRRRSPSPPRNKDPNLPPPGPKFIEWDYSIGQGMIKVLSRTLFVGGVTSSESHLRSLFGQFGIVQTCIVNVDKRHAFIKMVSRQDATQARDGMESYRTGEMQLRTRWGVGFGPRDCSDYQTGVSILRKPLFGVFSFPSPWDLTAKSPLGCTSPVLSYSASFPGHNIARLYFSCRRHFSGRQ
jgi:protein NRD1